MASSSSSSQLLQQDPSVYITTILLTSTTTLLLLFLFRRNTTQQHSDTNNKPLPPSDRGWIPFLGVAFSFYADVNKYLTEKHEQHQPNQPFRIYFMGRWWTLVYQLADVKLILNSKDNELSFLESLNDCMKRMLPKKFSLLPRHGFFRNVFREANQPLIAQWFVEEIPKIVSLMLPPASPASASPAPAAGAIDLFKTCRHISMRVSLRALFGPQIFVNGRYERYYAAFSPIYPEERLLEGVMLLLRDPNRKERAWDTVTEITGEIMDYYTELEKKKGGSGELECVMHFLVRQHVEQQQEEQQQAGTPTPFSFSSTLDLETVVNDTFTFVWASNTSTYLVLAWSIWEMIGNKGNLRDRVLAETSTKLDNNNNKTNPTNLAQVVEEWVAGKAMVDEVIRLQTPGLLLRKVMAPEGVTLSTGHHVPMGEFVGFSYPWIQTYSEFYQNPLEFDIDRYLVRDEKKKAGIYSITWGGGRHVCMGTRFAMMEIYLVIHEIFSNYTLTKITEEVGVRKEQLGFPRKPANPVYIKVVEKKRTGVSS